MEFPVRKHRKKSQLLFVNMRISMIFVLSSIRIPPKVFTNEIRFKTIKALRTVKSPRANVSKRERLALKNLKSNTNIAILQVDKDNAASTYFVFHGKCY